MLKGSAILQQILRVGHQGRREDDTVSGQDVITKECMLQDQKQDLQVPYAIAAGGQFDGEEREC